MTMKEGLARESCKGLDVADWSSAQEIPRGGDAARRLYCVFLSFITRMPHRLPNMTPVDQTFSHNTAETLAGDTKCRLVPDIFFYFLPF